LQASFGPLVFEDGAGIFRCPDGRISHFQSNGFVFLFMGAFGTTARVVESGRAHARNIGRRKLKLIESAISASHANCDCAATKSSSSGNAHFDENIRTLQFLGYSVF
jgi:hypothetical protein